MPTATTTPLRLGRIDLVRDFTGDLEKLAVQLVVFHKFHMNGLKGPKTHVQCDLRHFNAFGFEPLQDPRREMQSGGWSRHAAPGFRTGVTVW